MIVKRKRMENRKYLVASRIYKSAVYYCRGDQKGLALDRAAMIIASQNLGHNRESVVGEHYLRLSK